MKSLLIAGALSGLLSVTGLAQAPKIMDLPVPPPEMHEMEGGAMGQKFFRFVGVEGGIMGKVVKGAPYTADAVTESTQTLADGNQIKRSSTAHIARDIDGRTRSEETLSNIGPWSTEGQAETVVMIHDPVSGSHYVLDPAKHTVQTMSVKTSTRTMQTGAAGTPGPVGISDLATRIKIKAPENVETQTEDLGTQTMEGVQVQGKRMTNTIPAGAMGNSKPLQVVTETWYSPELQTMVMSRHSDPRMGETVFKLTNVSRGEPAATLFQVPADYTAAQTPSKVIRYEQHISQ